jgi:hypothetical protein
MSLEAISFDVAQVADAIELHEDEVPDFDVAAAIAAEFAIGVALVGSGRAHVVVNFAARAARAGIAHGPEIFLQAGNRNHALARRANIDPKLQRLFVRAQNFSRSNFGAAKDGERQLIDRNPEPIRRRDQFPGVGDGVFHKIIAEGKIAEHLEKRVMAVGEANVFEVVVLAAGADALLRRGGARIVALLKTEEHILELVHPGVGEEQRGIIRRDKRRAAHDAVPALGEEFEEHRSNLVARSTLQVSPVIRLH